MQFIPRCFHCETPLANSINQTSSNVSYTQLSRQNSNQNTYRNAQSLGTSAVKNRTHFDSIAIICTLVVFKHLLSVLEALYPTFGLDLLSNNMHTVNIKQITSFLHINISQNVLRWYRGVFAFLQRHSGFGEGKRGGGGRVEQETVEPVVCCKTNNSYHALYYLQHADFSYLRYI